jgi:hypothetical protein
LTEDILHLDEREIIDQDVAGGDPDERPVWRDRPFQVLRATLIA